MTTAIEFNPFTSEFQQEPYGFYRQMRDKAPVHYIEALDAWGLFRYEDCLYTFKHPELFSSKDFTANNFGEFDPVPEVPSMISLDPPEHSRLRKLANHAFIPSVIRKLQPDIEAVVEGLLDEVQESGAEFDFVSQYAAYVPSSVVAVVLGLDPALARGDFKRWSMDLIKAPSRTVLSEDELASMRRSVNEMRDYFSEQIEYRKRNPGKDLISALVRAEEDDESLTSTEVLSLLAIIQFGGSETPSHLIGTTLFELFENPEALRTVKEDPQRSVDALDETLRHQTTVHFVPKTVMQDVDVQGTTIPCGSTVFAFIGSGNRDERIFTNPDTFDIDREGKNKHLGFARGAHYCIGDNLGRVMCSAAVRKALSRIPGLHPVEQGVEWHPSFWIRGPKELLVAS